ncbi:hypothetical protein ES692_06155 [Psychroserpens burtonensis]|uniref:Uncharacterized protein n=1 Tax=Psychroserpens burtonensis TaxID=49278 RepID=A0A5C7BA83_9FLAO|nr:hypothetical protein [Psychroserpens burtonensis]TXE18624.1 hypothetical protein ES692_06155 [Psychroserpens burtonensis]
MAEDNIKNAFEGIQMDVLNDYIEKGTHQKDMEPEIVVYMSQLEFVQKRLHRVESPNNVVNSLKAFYPDLSLHQAKRVFNDALQFFHLDDDTSKQAWNNYLFNMAMQAIELTVKSIGPDDDPLKIVDAILKAKMIKGLDKDQDAGVDPKLLEERYEIFSLTPSDLGLPEANRNILAAQIDQFPITENDKLKLKMEGGAVKKRYEILMKTNGKTKD